MNQPDKIHTPTELTFHLGGDRQYVCVQLLRLFATPWTIAHQAPLSMGFSRQEVGVVAILFS